MGFSKDEQAELERVYKLMQQIRDEGADYQVRNTEDVPEEEREMHVIRTMVFFENHGYRLSKKEILKKVAFKWKYEVSESSQLPNNEFDPHASTKSKTSSRGSHSQESGDHI